MTLLRWNSTSPHQNQRNQLVPGAVAVPGWDATGDGDEEGTFQYHMGDAEDDAEAPVTAEPVDEATEEENRRLREQLEHHTRVLHERNSLRQMFEHVAVAQVLDAPDVNEQEVQNEVKQCSFVDCSSKKCRWISAVVILLVVVLGVVVAVVVLTPGSNDDPMPAPTTPPNTPPNTPTPELIDLLANVSSDNGMALRTNSTPQNNAYKWLANNTSLTSYSDEKKIQRYALAALYYSTGGDDWKHNDLWLDNGDECGRWYMDVEPSTIKCTSEGAVKDISLLSNNLTGTIPPEIGLFSDSLAYIKLDGSNQLHGTIPTEIGSMTNLTFLSLLDNSLAGTIPSEIGQMTKLVGLHLSGNQLNGTIPAEIGSMMNLKFLSLLDNSLAGTIPSEIGQLTKLVYLYLSTNELNGTIPAEIGSMTNAEYLRLSDNILAGTIPSEIGQLTEIVVLYLSTNQLNGTIPAEIGSMTNVEDLWLSDNSLAGTIPSEIGQLTRLEVLFLDRNQLSGTIPSVIHTMTSLDRLDLEGNTLTGNFTCLDSIDDCKISCNDGHNETCRSL